MINIFFSSFLELVGREDVFQGSIFFLFIALVMKSRMDLRLCMPFPFPLPHLAMCVLPQFRVVSTMQNKYTAFL